MTPCPCGCKQPVKPGNRYAARGCAGRVVLRAIPRDERAARSSATQARLHPGVRKQRMRGLRQVSKKAAWLTLLERWLDDMKPREALREAYWLGYSAGYLARRRSEPVRQAS